MNWTMRDKHSGLLLNSKMCQLKRCGLCRWSLKIYFSALIFFMHFVAIGVENLLALPKQEMFTCIFLLFYVQCRQFSSNRKYHVIHTSFVYSLNICRPSNDLILIWYFPRNTTFDIHDLLAMTDSKSNNVSDFIW